MKSKPVIVAIAVVLILAGGGLWWWEHRAPAVVPEASGPVSAAPEPAPVPSAPASAAPAILHPIEAAAGASQAASQALPALSASDAKAAEELTGLVGAKNVATHFLLDGFVRRFVATVDNLAQSHASPRLWPVPPQPGRFTVGEGGGTTAVGAGNAARYAPFVAFAESVDSQRAVAAYVRLYPLFQQAYEELGYPGKYFNDRLVAVIDQLLATPNPTAPLEVTLTEVKGPEKSLRPWVRYEFVDPELQGLSSGQKMLLRVGPPNEAKLKAKLTELRRLLVGAVKP
ncbi:MAG: hypothetical protein JWP52_969 [Rhizobacter sp.]|nr:hypothetical protein [Rhizobacter sp.]